MSSSSSSSAQRAATALMRIGSAPTSQKSSKSTTTTFSRAEQQQLGSTSPIIRSPLPSTAVSTADNSIHSSVRKNKKKLVRFVEPARPPPPPPTRTLPPLQQIVNAHSIVDINVRRKRAWQESAAPESPVAQSPPPVSVGRVRVPNPRYPQLRRVNPQVPSMAVTMQETAERIVAHCGTLAFTNVRGGLQKRFVELTDLAALELAKRRIYDVLNVLEPLGVTSRASKGKFEWNGVERAREVVAELRAANAERRVHLTEMAHANLTKISSRVLTVITCDIISRLIAAEIESAPMSARELRLALANSPIVVSRARQSVDEDAESSSEGEDDDSTQPQDGVEVERRTLSTRSVLRRSSDVLTVLSVIGVVKMEQEEGKARKSKIQLCE